MRDDRTKQNWAVQITPFQLGKLPITQAQFFAITGKTPSVSKGEQNPVESVSWFDAVHFCNALSVLNNMAPCYEIGSDKTVGFHKDADGYRLPSEAEWEYACRAGTNEPRYGALADIAWFKDNAENQIHPVGQKIPNEWGLYDMIGNVWEWCWDQYDSEEYGNYRIFRGGGWADPERGCLATNRRRSHPTFSIDDLGFRVARSI